MEPSSNRNNNNNSLGKVNSERTNRQRRESSYDFGSKSLPLESPNNFQKTLSAKFTNSPLQPTTTVTRSPASSGFFNKFKTSPSPTIQFQPELHSKPTTTTGTSTTTNNSNSSMNYQPTESLNHKSSSLSTNSNSTGFLTRNYSPGQSQDQDTSQSNNQLTPSSSLRSYRSLNKSNSDSQRSNNPIDPSPIEPITTNNHDNHDDECQPTTTTQDNELTTFQWPAVHKLKAPLHKRTSLSRLTMLGLDANLAKSKGLAYPGLLSQIVKRFKKTSQEVMTGTQILDFLERAAGLPPKTRDLSHFLCDSLSPYTLFKHTGDDDFPVLDGDEEIYVVNINRLQNPNFTPRSVLTYLTPCYMPTCTKSFPCGRLSCPTQRQIFGRNLGELRIVNPDLSSGELTVSHTKNSSSFDAQSIMGSDLNPSGFDVTSDPLSKEAELWIQAVPREVSDTVSENEKKRQELIYETIKTEVDFVNDLQLIDRIFVQNMRRGEVYDPNRIEAVLITLFSNYTDILAINSELLEGLRERQRQNYVVTTVGDLFLNWSRRLDSYVYYGSRLAYAQDFIKKEIEFNTAFAQYLKECERHPEARRLSIQSFVGRATTRLGRYPLLLEGILKKTSPGSPDLDLIPQALAFVKAKLEEVNRSAGEAEEKLKINYISSHLYFKPEDSLMDIDLENQERRLLKEGVLRRTVGHGSQPIIAFLFDNVLVLAKEKKKVVTEYRAICPAIPIYAMHVQDEVSSRSFRLAESLLLSQKVPTDTSANSGVNSDANGYGFSITHHGKKTVAYCLLATSAKERNQWTEALHNARESNPLFSVPVLSVHEVYQSHATQNHILASTRCNIKGEDYYLFGCDNGVYVLTKSGALKRILRSATRVVQLEALIEYHVLVVLFGDKYLMAYQLEVVTDPTGKNTTVSTKLSENVNFFRIGVCNDRHLLISAKYHSQKSNFKTMQFVRFADETRASMKNKLLWQSRHSTGLRVVKKFYVGTIGNGISFLKTKLSIACGPGFEIVDLEALYLNKGIPDRTSSVITSNPRLSALFENCTPMAMYRINPSEFLLCYKEFGFYVDNNGRPSRDIKSVLDWSGIPNDFVYCAPYIVCFDNDMIEVRHAQTGNLSQIIMTGSLQFTNPSHSFTSELHAVAELPGVANGQRFFRLAVASPP